MNEAIGMMKHRRRPWRSGFTIIELLVAMVVSVIMLFVVNRLFLDTTRAISQGIALSDMIAATRTISDQLERDAATMTGPVISGSGGFLVILNHRYSNVDVVDDTGGPTERDIRSDQLVFIRSAVKDPMNPEVTEVLEPLCPGNTTSFSNGTTAGFARVWYGHVLRTDPDGTGPAAGDALGAKDINGEGPNKIGTDWVLGRQAMLLAGAAPSSVYASASAAYNAAVTGYGVGTIPPVETVYMGLSDVSDRLLSEITGDAGTTPLDAAMTDAAYHSAAYNYTYGVQRLRVNPLPIGSSFDAWKVAQMHAYFMGHVSDFIVEFAADMNADGVIDKDVAAAAGVDKNGRSYPAYAGGGIKWYSHYANDPNDDPTNKYDSTQPVTYAPPVSPGTNEPYDAGLGIANATAGFVWRHDDGTAASVWPYLIRIRYRLHDARGRFQALNANSGQAEPGRWFEQIIPVDRP